MSRALNQFVSTFTRTICAISLPSFASRACNPGFDVGERKVEAWFSPHREDQIATTLMRERRRGVVSAVLSREERVWPCRFGK